MADCTRLDTMTDLILESVASSYEEGILTFEAAKEKSEKGLTSLIQGLFKTIQELLRKAIEKIQSNHRAKKLGKTLDPETRALINQAKKGSLKGPDILKLTSIVRKTELFIDKFMDQSFKMIDDLVASRSMKNLSVMNEKKRQMLAYCDQAQAQYAKFCDEGNAIASKTIVYSTNQACDMVEAGLHQPDTLDRLVKRMDDVEKKMLSTIKEVEYETGNILQRAPRIIKEAVQKVISIIRKFVNEHKMLVFAIDTAVMMIITMVNPAFGMKIRMARTVTTTGISVAKTVRDEVAAQKILNTRPDDVQRELEKKKKRKKKNSMVGMDEDILNIAKSTKR